MSPSKKRPHLLDDLHKWEIVFLLFSSLLFIISFYCYVADVSFRKYFFKLNEDEERMPIAKISDSVGEVRREESGGIEFKSIDKQATLFSQDTLVTGPASKAQIELKDGGKLELTANSMVKLDFETQFSFNGIARAASVQVITGTVTGILPEGAKASKIMIRSSRGEQVVVAKGEKKISVKSAEAAPLVPVIQKIAPPPATLKTFVEPEPPPPSPLQESPRPEILAMPSQTPSSQGFAVVRPSTLPSPIVSLVASPSPSPTKLRRPLAVALISPKDSAKVSIPAHSKELKLNEEFSWNLKNIPEKSEVKWTLYRLSTSDAGELRREKVTEKSLTPRVPKEVPNPKQDTVIKEVTSHSFDAPGNYEWELRAEAADNQESAEARAKFTIEPEFIGIETLEPLVGGEISRSNRYMGKHLSNFDITFRWKPYPGAEKYRVWLAKSEKATKPLRESMVTDAQFSFNKDVVFNGLVYYRIFAVLPSGFTPRSETVPFSFTFLPPNPTQPVDQSVISDATLTNRSVLFTWQKTNFTEEYEIEIATDSEFTNVAYKHKLTDNFLLVPLKNLGTYWWRVRSYSKSLVSAASPPSQFKLTP
jgi:hypothetical protein